MSSRPPAVASQVIDPPRRTAGVAAQAYGAVVLDDGRVRLAWAGAGPLGAGGAAGDAATVQRQAAGLSAAVSAAAEREAAEIRRQASAQSEAIRRAAEREAAELKAVIEMSVRLGGVVAGPGDLIAVAQPVTRPAGQLITLPATPPAARPAALPAANPRTRQGTGTKGRQARAMRVAVAVMVTLVLAGVASGSTEIALNGLPFFFFRNAGAGAGNSQHLNEDQGPGQPDAPGAQHSAPAVRPGGQPRPGRPHHQEAPGRRTSRRATAPAPAAS